MRTLKWLTLTSVLAFVAPGCGGTDNTAPVAKEEVAKVPTEAVPEKSKAGKPNLNKTASSD